MLHRNTRRKAGRRGSSLVVAPATEQVGPGASGPARAGCCLGRRRAGARRRRRAGACGRRHHGWWLFAARRRRAARARGGAGASSGSSGFIVLCLLNGQMVPWALERPLSCCGRWSSLLLSLTHREIRLPAALGAATAVLGPVVWAPRAARSRHKAARTVLGRRKSPRRGAS